MITLRRVTADDTAFLRRLYGSTREEELNQVVWPEGAREAFLDQQFQAQSDQYALVYPDASFDVILRDGEPIGRLYVNRGAEDIRIIDIALVPVARGQGVGTRLLVPILAEGAATGRRVSIHVEKFNPAMRLYQRLGFREVEDRGVYLLLAVG